MVVRPPSHYTRCPSPSLAVISPEPYLADTFIHIDAYIVISIFFVGPIVTRGGGDFRISIGAWIHPHLMLVAVKDKPELMSKIVPQAGVFTLHKPVYRMM